MQSTFSPGSQRREKRRKMINKRENNPKKRPKKMYRSQSVKISDIP